jgi:hypothetical protein
MHNTISILHHTYPNRLFDVTAWAGIICHNNNNNSRITLATFKSKSKEGMGSTMVGRRFLHLQCPLLSGAAD